MHRTPDSHTTRAKSKSAVLPRVVVTGMGVVSCVGNGCDALLDALRQGKTGIRAMPAFAQLGMRSQVGGPVDVTAMNEPPRKLRRYMSPPALYAWHAMNEAITQAELTAAQLASDKCGLVIGGSPAVSEYESALALLREKGIHKLSPFAVPRSMGSNLSASLAHAFGIQGNTHTVSSACTSAAHAIGQAMQLIQLGKQSIVLCGGSEELHASSALGFDVMGALSSAFNHDPQRASRPYDTQRDGFVLAAGAGMLVLESLEHAQARGAAVLAELSGYGTSTDPLSMVGPGAEGIARAMRDAIDDAGVVPAYINTQACSTAQGDLAEWHAIGDMFASRELAVPPLSSIKSQTGHAPGAASALDAIASVLMMQHSFIAAGCAIDQRDPAFADAPLVTENREQTFNSVLSNSFGFGGSCASLLFVRAQSGAP
jgi:3-oxoacyl-[acyl-carrier-protein] synthase-1